MKKIVIPSEPTEPILVKDLGAKYIEMIKHIVICFDIKFKKGK